MHENKAKSTPLYDISFYFLFSIIISPTHIRNEVECCMVRDTKRLYFLTMHMPPTHNV